MSAPLVIAIPSKGRLEENTAAFFAAAGLKISRRGGSRNYRGRIAGVEGVEIAFLSASEITSELAAGAVHLGVTGEDLVRERLGESAGIVEMITPLGFGHAEVVVGVPRAWIDVATFADLVDVARDFRAHHGRRLRVATKYTSLTSRFFAGHGLTDYRIVQSLGATEGAPAAGTAEIIVDITSSGATLAANDLKVPRGGVMLKSQASLVASLGAPWSRTARGALAHILDHVAAEERARASYELRADWSGLVPNDAVEALIAKTGASRVGGGENDIVLHVPRAALRPVTTGLKAVGAMRVSVFTLEYVFEAHNPLLDALTAAIDKAEASRR